MSSESPYTGHGKITNRENPCERQIGIRFTSSCQHHHRKPGAWGRPGAGTIRGDMRAGVPDTALMQQPTPTNHLTPRACAGERISPGARRANPARVAPAKSGMYSLRPPSQTFFLSSDIIKRTSGPSRLPCPPRSDDSTAHTPASTPAPGAQEYRPAPRLRRWPPGHIAGAPEP